MEKVRTRIAPSPTGVPHVGNTRNALFDYLFARKYDGQFILRIEDTDQKRFKADALKKIYEIFDFLNLIPDEGPVQGGPYASYIQTERLDIYKKYTEILIQNGAAYHCFCNENENQAYQTDDQESHARIAKYDKRCLKLTKQEVEQKLADGQSSVVRINMPTDGYCTWNDAVQGKISIPYSEVDDKVLLKSNGIPTYHLAVVVDDHLMEITHVLRGVEWISSTPVHLELYKAFGWEPSAFYHMPLLLGPDKSKLSKRHGAKNVLEYRDEGYLSEALNNFMLYLGFSYQDNSALLTLDEMVKIFDEKKLQKQNAVFDIEKLNWFNKQWLKKLDSQELASRILDLYADSKKETYSWKDTYPTDRETLSLLVDVTKTRVTVLKEFIPFIDQIWGEIDSFDLEKASGFDLGTTKTNLQLASDSLSEVPNWSATDLEQKLRADIQQNGLDARTYFSAIRAGTTNQTVSPPLFDTLVLIGKEKTLDRIKKALES